MRYRALLYYCGCWCRLSIGWLLIGLLLGGLEELLLLLLAFAWWVMVSPDGGLTPDGSNALRGRWCRLGYEWLLCLMDSEIGNTSFEV